MPFSALAGCTVVTADYLPWVRVTATSFAEHHPGAEFAVLVIDEPEPSQLRDGDQFTLLRPADVGLSEDELAWMDLIYSPVELCCALKPWLIRRMLDQAEVVLYIDADICVYAPLTEVANQARQCAVVLSPHSLAPRTDPRMPDDDALLQFGQFNGGFLAVSRNGRDFVDWWAAKCARESTDWNPAVPRRYLDQRWLDLAIGYFDSQLTRDPGINLARWNMYQHNFDLVDGRFVVDGEPLRCFHFSAFNPADPTNIRRDGYTHPKVDPQQNPALRELLEDYAHRLLAAGWEPAGDKPAPRTVAGIELTPAVRASIRAALIDAERLGAVPADAARKPEKLAAWLQSPVRADLNISWYQWGQRATSAAVPPAPAPSPEPERAATTERADPGSTTSILKGGTIWLTGISGAGKTTIAQAMAELLRESGRRSFILDGDILRSGLSSDLGLSREDRSEQARRTAHVAALLQQSGVTAIVALVSPYEQDRVMAREIHVERELDFFEVWVNTPMAVCEERDVKGLYARNRAGKLQGLTGVDAPYEPPVGADLEVAGFAVTPEELAQRILAAADRSPEIEVSDQRPLLSVLMPSYNTAPYIERCLRSVTGQSFERFEVLILDDRSTDGTYEMLEQLTAGDDRIQLVRNETNLGALKNFQRLLGLARGDYINFICCDDLLRADSFERKVALLEERPDVAIVAGNKLVVDPNDQPLADRNEYIWTHTPFGTDSSTFVVDGFEAGNTMLVDLNNWIGEPTAAMFRNGILNPADPYGIGIARPARNLDFCWWLKLMAGSQLGYINEPLSYFRHHAGQQSKDSALVADLTLSWYDVIVGAVSLGFLESPMAQVAALKRVAEHIESRLPQLLPDHVERTQRVLNNVAETLQELAGQPRSRSRESAVA